MIIYREIHFFSCRSLEVFLVCYVCAFFALPVTCCHLAAFNFLESSCIEQVDLIDGVTGSRQSATEPFSLFLKYRFGWFLKFVLFVRFVVADGPSVVLKIDYENRTNKSLVFVEILFCFFLLYLFCKRCFIK